MAQINLPQFDFRGVVASPTLQPVDDFIASRDILLDNYELAQDRLSAYQQARAALQAAPFEADQQALADLNSRFDQRFAPLQEREDLENLAPTAKRMLSDFGAGALPIMQRKKDFDDLKTKILSDPNIIDKGRAIRAVELQEQQSPTLQNIDGNLVNSFDPGRSGFVFTPGVNMFEIVDDAVRGAKTDISSIPPHVRELKNAQGKTIGEIIASGKTESLSPEQVRTIAENALAGRQDVEAFRQSEESFGGLGLANNFEAQRDAAINAAIEKYDTNRNTLTSHGQFTRPEGGGGLLGSNSSSVITRSKSSADLVSSAQAYRDLSSQIQQARAVGDEELAQELESVRDNTNSQALQGLTDRERKIFNAFQDKTVDQVIQELGLNTPGSLAGGIETMSEEYAQIFNDIGIDPKDGRKSEVVDVLRKANKLIEKDLSNVPELSREWTTFGGTSSGEFKSVVGEVQRKLQQDIDSKNISLIKAFTKDNNTDFNSYLDDKYIEYDHDEYGKIDYNPDLTEVGQTDGISIDGFPMIEVSVFGSNKDRKKQFLGSELVTKGEEGWNDYINTARGLMASPLAEDQQKGQMMLLKSTQIGGQRIGGYIAKRNLPSMKVGGEKPFNLGNFRGRIRKVGDQDYRLMFGNDVVSFSTEDDLVQMIGSSLSTQ